jgi:hypothetical protein
MERDRLTAALLGREPLSEDEWVDKHVRDLQDEAILLVREISDRVRRHLPGQSAQTASDTGDHRQARAIAKQLTEWSVWEKRRIEFFQSSKVVDEARRWMHLRIKHGPENADADGPLPTRWCPQLFVWVECKGPT